MSAVEMSNKEMAGIDIPKRLLASIASSKHCLDSSRIDWWRQAHE
jgi:hypothetical protein